MVWYTMAPVEMALLGAYLTTTLLALLSLYYATLIHREQLLPAMLTKRNRDT